MGKKILIIDDEIDIMKMMAYRLNAKGYEVITAIDGKTGIELVKSQKPDLILLDYRLADLNGPAVVSEIKGNQEFKDIPIILITASVDKIREIAKECKVVDYIAKPISPEELYEKIEKHIGR